MEEIAASKGFDSAASHRLHLTRQLPNICGILYRVYTETFQCLNPNRNGKQIFNFRRNYSSIICDDNKEMLVSDCKARVEGKSLYFPDDSHLRMPSFIMVAEMFGVDYLLFNDASSC